MESQIAVAGGIAYFGSEQVYALKGPAQATLPASHTGSPGA